MKENRTREILISGYGPGKNNQKSISLYSLTDRFDVLNEIWSDKKEAPSFLCTYHDICFGIRESEQDGSVLVYRRQDDKYILEDELVLDGGALCHVVYQPKNKTLYCSFYETGHIAAIKVENYHFTEISNFYKIQPAEMNGFSRVHCSALEPDGNSIFVTNIALDRIYIFDTENGALKINSNLNYIQLEKGLGPRHIKFHPIQNYLYLITEYSNEILTLLYEKNQGTSSLKLLQRISTLPNDFKGKSTGSSLDISKDGRFLYAANRGADTIAVFDINPDGTLTKIQDISCGGNIPRHIALTKDDTGLMIANQKSNEVVILDVDMQNGMLSDVIVRIPFFEPSFVEEN